VYFSPKVEKYVQRREKIDSKIKITPKVVEVTPKK
jgi:hypothetical protein